MKYPSKYSNGKDITAAQYLAEFICERLAKIKKKDLHYRFWLSKEWEKEYKGQIGAANKLLKKYEIKHIIHALKSSRGSKIYSLRAPHLPGIIDSTPMPVDKESKKIDRLSINTSKGKSVLHKKNIIDIIKDIENGS